MNSSTNTPLEITLSPKEYYVEHSLLQKIAHLAKCDPQNLPPYHIIKKNIDARQKNIKVNLTIAFSTQTLIPKELPFFIQNVSQKKEVAILGSGPAGYFAALSLISNGLKPVIFEQGSDVRKRKREIAAISTTHKVDPDSNYCFGEGGAGTFSDGKLFTRSKKRGNVDDVLKTFHYFGAEESVLYDAQPHIGTDRLPSIIEGMRHTIIDAGGEIHFRKKITSLKIVGGELSELIINNNEIFKTNLLLLAPGHSANELYAELWNKSVLLERKPFAIGLRIEHPEKLITTAMYHNSPDLPFLPAAKYNLLTRSSDDRGVFSFCMCPGGFVVPSATSPDEVVVNGMSPSNRGSKWSNSALIVETKNSDFHPFGAGESDPIAPLLYRKSLENLSWEHGGRSQTAPAQRVSDFINNKYSASLPASSYFPGVVSSNVSDWLPRHISEPLRGALPEFNKKIRGFITNEAILLAIETRTSSPIRIVRDLENCQSLNTKGIFPAGEGSGYAGGITSSAMDGIKVATAIANLIK